MKKTFKIIAGVASLFIALMFVAIIVIPLVVNPNDYKGEIAQLVKESTGRELTINGDIELSLFPWPGVTLGEVTLGNAAGFEAPYFARIDGAEVTLRLLPLLLSQQLEAGTIQLRGLRLNLTTAEDGTTNWAGPGGEQPATEPAAVAPPAASSGAGVALLAIGGVQIDDAQINYTDRASGVRYTIRQFNLETGPLSLNAPLALSLSSQFEASQPAISGELSLQTTVRIDLDSERYRFGSTTLNATLNSEALPGGQATVDLAAEIDLDMLQQTVRLSSLIVKSYGLDMSGELNIEQLTGEMAFNGELNIAEFNPRKVLPALDIELPATADERALSRMQLAFSLDGSLNQYNLNPLKLVVDESRLSGNLALSMNETSLPAIRYALSLDQLDADRYLPPPAAPSTAVSGTSKSAVTQNTTPPPLATPATAGAAAATLPMETLRTLELQGTLAIGKLTLSGLQLSEIKTAVAAREGKIRLYPLSAKLYQGEYSGDLRLDARGEQPVISLNESLKRVQLGPLLKDYMGEERVSGVGTVTAKLTASGDTQEAVTRTLTGTVTLHVTDGAMKGVNLVQLVHEAQAKLKGQPQPPPSAALNSTDFAEMKATINITNGVVRNRDLSIKSPYLRIGGEGQADLVQESLDYLAKAVITKTEQGQGGAEIDSLRGVTLPVRITGSFSEPAFKLELGDALKAQAKAAVAKKKAELKAKLEQERADEKAQLQQKLDAEKERLKQKAEEKLKGLFGR